MQHMNRVTKLLLCALVFFLGFLTTRVFLDLMAAPGHMGKYDYIQYLGGFVGNSDAALVLLASGVYVWLPCAWTHAEVLLSNPSRGAAIVVQLKGMIGHSPEVNFRGPFGVTVGADDRIYVADDLAHTIYVFDSQHHLRET